MEPSKDPKTSNHSLNPPTGHEHLKLGLGITIGFITVLIFWSIWAELDSAAVAQGQIDVASENKVIEHLEGGIVEKIFVNEGDIVDDGQLLLRLVDTQQYTNVQLLTYRLYHLQASIDRLNSYEEDLEEPRFQENLLFMAKSDPKVEELLDSQRERYISDRETFLGQMGLYERRIKEIHALIESIEGQIEALDEQLKLIDGEVEGLVILEKEQLVGKPTLLALQRRHAELRRQRKDLTGQMAQAKERISLIELESIQLKEERESERAEEMDTHFAGVLETMEQLTAAEDRLSRMEIRSPVKGKIVNLSEHTIGGVIGQGEKLMEIVPLSDSLVVEARVNPLDIDVVRPGLEAYVRLLSYSQRSTLKLNGTVKDVSAHVIVDTKTRESYYLARVEISAKELEGREDIELYPGMPVQVMILTGKRSPLDYLVAPIRDSFRRAFLEE